MKKFAALLMMLAIILVACTDTTSKNEPSPSSKTNLSSSTMPDDFGFSVSFGYGKKDEINTFNGTVTKDLIADGIVTIDLVLSDAEMLKVYEKMKEINVMNSKQFTPKPIIGERCEQEPYEEDEWKIIMDGKTVEHHISGKYCEPTEDTRQFYALRNFVFSKIKNKDEYIELPEASGGYD